MTALKILPLLIVISTVSYGQMGLKTTNSIDSSSQLITIDRLKKEIYDFMQIVIIEQNLNKGYGLSLIPQENCDLSKNDKDFLKELLIDTVTTMTTSESTDMEETIYTGQLEKCLRPNDIICMTEQKDKLSSFLWDNSKLGFDLSYSKKWYEFSVPLFSCDKTKVIMMISCLCDGMCGINRTVLFRKENGKWMSQEGPTYIH